MIHVAGTRTFAAEVVDYARDAGLAVAGLVETRDPARIGSEIHGLPVRALEDRPDGDARVIVGTGDVARREVVARLGRAGWEVTGLIHPTAHVAPSAQVAPTALIAPRAVVGAAVAIGDHVVVARGALVGHHTRIAPFATLGPGANVAGNAVIEEDAFLAMGCAVRDHVTVGAAAVVAMGAAVVSDVEAGARMQGVPARPG